MKRQYTFILVLFLTSYVLANMPTDSLVRFTDLRFQSEYEKQVFVNYRHENEFNLCLATDRNMTAEKAATLKTSFENMLKLLEKENLTVKNFRQKFKNTHKIIFHPVPMRHHEDAEFPDLLNNGDFNCMTSSILYSLALKKLNIPTYLMFALNKSTLLVYPGDRQVILETENREDQNGDFNTADKKGMIMNMLDKKVKPGSDYQLSPLQGNQVIRVNELEVLKNTQLPALIYYYKAIARYNAGKEDEAYRLISKACYLCPEDPYVTIMYTMLTNTMQKCEFKHVEDVDLLGQLSRFEEDNFNYIHKTFQSLVTARLVEKNDMEFGKAAYNRLLPQIKDVLLADEISYFYYMCSAYYKNTYRHNTRPALEALKLKPLDKSALQAIEMGLQYKLDSLNDPKSYLDTLNHYEKVLDKTEASGLLKKFRLLTYLDLAKHCFLSNQPQEGENYLTLFESDFQLPVPDISFKIKIENTYYEYARYYVRFNHRAMAQKIVDRGLKYIPNSNMIQTATYVLPRQKPNIIKRKMTKTEYENYMKKN